MKRLLLLSLFSALVLSAACTSPCVASTTISALNTATVTSSAIDTTGATLLVVTISGSADDSTTDTISSSPGNTFVHLTGQQATGGDRSGNVIWYVCGPATSAAQTVTIRGRYSSASIAAYSGTLTSNCYDTPHENGATNSVASQTSFSEGSVTPSVAGALIITSLGGPISDWSIDSGFSIAASVAYSNLHWEGSAQAYAVASTATNPTWTITMPGPGIGIAGVIASFLPAAVTTPPNSQVNIF